MQALEANIYACIRTCNATVLMNCMTGLDIIVEMTELHMKFNVYLHPACCSNSWPHPPTSELLHGEPHTLPAEQVVMQTRMHESSHECSCK